MDTNPRTMYTPTHPYLKIWNREDLESSDEFKELVKELLEYIFMKNHPLTPSVSKLMLYQEWQRKLSAITKRLEGVRDVKRTLYHQENRIDEVIQYYRTMSYLKRS